MIQTTNVEYDANGLRTRKVDSTGDSRFLLDGSSIVADYDTASGARTASYVQNPQRIDEIVAATVSVSGTPTKVFPLSDALGSIYALTDSSGNVVSNFSFDVYGARTQTNGTLALRMGFTAREHEADSGFMQYRQRWLFGSTGSFLEADPAEEEPNMYSYGGGSPTQFSDPMGLFKTLVVYARSWTATNGLILNVEGAAMELALGKAIGGSVAAAFDMQFFPADGPSDLAWLPYVVSDQRIQTFVFVGHGNYGVLGLYPTPGATFDGTVLANAIVNLNLPKLTQIILIACRAANAPPKPAMSRSFASNLFAGSGSPTGQVVADGTGVFTQAVTGLYQFNATNIPPQVTISDAALQSFWPRSMMCKAH